jgi:uroporphyrin-III C-methyltransferase/precorrin-2 dehydrogenase/sirohydrochlorin ferrochelatase
MLATPSLVPTLIELFGMALQRVSAMARARLAPPRSAGLSASSKSQEGHVLLAGAGPGDPELLTLKTLRAIEAADIILHDQLVSPEILALVPARVDRIDVGKKGYGRAYRQSDINALMVGLARAGRRVVRLKAGDPLMFGRLDEEIAALEDAGIVHAVIPGISAAQGAASALGVGLTRRGGARRFQAITGHAADGRMPDDFDWSGLADPKATTAVYMPRATIATLCAELQGRGLPANHPAVAVFNASRANQKVIVGSITTLPDRIAADESGAPCIVLFGLGARAHDSVSERAAAQAVVA